MNTSDLSETEIKKYVGKTQRVGRTLKFFESIDSTNAYCKREMQEDGVVVIAGRQSAGHGRMGRSFQSADGGIYLSAVLKPDISADRIMSVTSMSAVAVCRAIEIITGVAPGIKWTNDVVMNGRKVCGILTELTFSGSNIPDSIIIGIGINVNRRREQFDGDVKKVASSVCAEVGRNVSLSQLAACVIRELDVLYSALLSGETSLFLDYYRKVCLTTGKDVRLIWRDGAEIAYALDVDDTFGLIVRHADGRIETVRTGEVSVRGLYGYTD